MRWYRHTLGKRPCFRYNDEWQKRAARIHSDKHGYGWIYQPKESKDPWLCWDNGYAPKYNEVRNSFFVPFIKNLDDRVRAYDYDIRQILIDNSVKDIQTEIDVTFVTTVDNEIERLKAKDKLDKERWDVIFTRQ